MQLRNLNKSVKEVLQNDYVVPLYQRNYAWGDEEIFQLLQDVYENFSSNREGNYFVGSLVVLKRKNGVYEVIDGQQRLTTLSLIAKIIDKEGQKSSKLSYDSRPEVESFLNSFYQTGSVSETTSNHLISHFSKAVEFINSANLNITSDSRVLISSLNKEDLDAFKSYFFNNVVLVLVEIPKDTDVAHYFEVMNNRGEQLEKHEILKASLLEQLKESKKASDVFSKAWDACSQMNTPIQRLFKKEDREMFFGDNYDDFYFEITDYGEGESISKDYLSIEDILNDKSLKNGGSKEQTEVEDKVESIIDFPNFLMQVLKLYFQSDELEVPLNGDDLLTVFKEQKEKIDSLKFIKYLLFYRTVFDRFVVKTTEDESSEDNYKWSLTKPTMYHDGARDQDKLDFIKSFKNQERIIKCLSMLQVTFRTKKYKNWLNSVLSWFNDTDDLNISAEDYLSKLEILALNTFDKNEFSKELSKETSYAEGTKTPHYLFNFLDYLLWLDNPKMHDVFQFKYRNSVEHHLPQSFEKDDNKDYLDHFGNLCLVSKGGNSRMNNEEPSGKAKQGGKFYNKALPPKQRSMYDLTNERNEWGVNEIKEHYNFIINIIDNRTKLLNQ